MLSFKTFLSEAAEPNWGGERNFVGHGDNAREFMENLIMPYHVYDPLKHAVNEALMAEADLSHLPSAHEYLQQHPEHDKSGGNILHHMRRGAEAAFPEGEHEHVRVAKHKEAVTHWNNFKSNYEKSENARRATIGHPKKLSLGHGSNLMSSNGKYDPEKHVGAEAHGKKVKILGLALAPHTIGGGNNVCPKATKGCKSTCLALHAGMNQGEERNYHLKVARTQFLQKHPEHAVRMLSHEIQRHGTGAKKKGFEPAVRLNANSDLNIEHILPHQYWNKFGKGGQHEVKHYDYTKVAGRMSSPAKRENLAKKGYHLTLSSTGTGHAESNDKDVSKHLHAGGNAAVVFRTREHNELPHTLVVHHPNGTQTGHPVHNANVRDDRYNDAEHHAGGSPEHHKFLAANPHIQRGAGHVSGLTFKGNTKKDLEHTEFAVDAHKGVAHIHGHL
jgi:hypothetical protein